MVLLGALNPADIVIPGLLGLFLGFGFFMIRMAYRQYKQEQQEIKNLAKTLGWEHRRGDDSVLDRFGFLNELSLLNNLSYTKRMGDVMEGELNGRRALVFNCVLSMG